MLEGFIHVNLLKFKLFAFKNLSFAKPLLRATLHKVWCQKPGDIKWVSLRWSFTPVLISWLVNLPPCKVPPWEMKPEFSALLREQLWLINPLLRLYLSWGYLTWGVGWLAMIIGGSPHFTNHLQLIFRGPTLFRGNLPPLVSFRSLSAFPLVSRSDISLYRLKMFFWFHRSSTDGVKHSPPYKLCDLTPWVFCVFFSFQMFYFLHIFSPVFHHSLEK